MIIRFKIKKENVQEGEEDEEDNDKVIILNNNINFIIRLNWSCLQDY